MICPYCQSQNDDFLDACFQCGKSLTSLTQGAVLLKRYEIVSMLGKGGMGFVYKAHDRELDETVAVKVMRPGSDRADELARRFRDEIKLARRIRHRNVCGIHEYGQDGHLQIIVMEFVDGIDLKQVLKRQGKLPPAEVFDISLQLTSGLAAIHETGIVHRDIKTPNIMRDRQGLVRLMDFGIAKQVDIEATKGATATGFLVGTPEYMSPEQARGEKVDLRSDLYALGIVIYELLTGDVPFRAETPVATLLKHLDAHVTFTGEGIPDLPPSMIPVLKKALAKDRNQRFASASEMRVALERAKAEWEGAVGSTVVLPAGEAVRAQAATATFDQPTMVSEARAAGGPPPVTPRPMAGPAASRVEPRPGPPAQRSFRWVWGVVAGFSVLLVLVGVAVLRPRPVPLPTGEPPIVASPTVASGAVVGLPAATPQATAPPVAENRQSAVASSPTPRVVPNASRPPAASTPDVTRATIKLTPIVTPTVAPAVASPTPNPAVLVAAAERPGRLKLRIEPWAEIEIDGRSYGSTPMAPIALAPGKYTVVMRHPSYKPLQRKVVVRAGEITAIEIVMAEDAFPLK